MIYYSKYPLWKNDLIKSFKNEMNDKSIDIDDKLFYSKKSSKNIVCFIAIDREEELSLAWLFFFRDFASNKKNIGKDLTIYFFGAYDFEVKKSSTIIKQIKYLTKYLSLNIYIYPMKLSKNRIDINNLVYFYNHNKVFLKKNNKFNNLIDKIIFISKDKPIKNNRYEIDFTSENDEYSSILDKFNNNKKKELIKELILLCDKETLILNRLNLPHIEEILTQVSSCKIKHLYLKSNSIENLFDLTKFMFLDLINLTANNIQIIDFKNFPENIRKINVTKSKVNNLLIDREYQNIITLTLFNNQLQNINNINHLKNLYYLNIGLNPLSKLPKELFLLEKLEHLNISFLNIIKISKKILRLKNLKLIDITGCKNLQSKKVLKKLKEKGVKIIC